MTVECGVCPACKQKKAGKRASRIRHNMVMKNGFPAYDVIFGTLTYANEYIPYIRISDVNKFFENNDIGIPIYRDRDRRLYRKKYVNHNELKILDVVGLEGLMSRSGSFDHFEDVTFEPLRKWIGKNRWEYFDTDKVSVCYFRDIQNFVKRSRINAERAGCYDKIKIFQCSEYGENGCRAHFHFLAFVPRGTKQFWKEIFAQSWPYDYNVRRRIKDDLGAASYLSTYVNNPSSLCSFLSGSPCFRPRHSFSLGFGLGFEDFQFDKLIECIRKGDFIYSEDIMSKRGKSIKVDSVIPQYVINQFFPKFKGYSKFDAASLYSFLSNPASITEFLDDKQFVNSIRSIIVDLSRIYQYRDYGKLSYYDIYNMLNDDSIIKSYISSKLFIDDGLNINMIFSSSKVFDNLLRVYYPWYIDSYQSKDNSGLPVISKYDWTLQDLRNIIIMLLNKKRNMVGLKYMQDGKFTELSEYMYIDMYCRAWQQYYSSISKFSSTQYDNLSDIDQFQHYFCNNDFNNPFDRSAEKFTPQYRDLVPGKIKNINDNPIEIMNTKFYTEQYMLRSKDRKCKTELASYFYKY